MGYQRIINFIKKSYENVPLYKNIAKERGISIINHIEDVPVIGKKEFVGRQNECINPRYSGKYIHNELLLRRTSGSTGQYLQIMWDTADIDRSLIELWLRRAKNHGIFPHSRLVLFFSDALSDDRYRQHKNELGISMRMLLPHNIENAYANILSWEPEWMILQPQTAVLLAEFVKRSGRELPSSLKYIEFTGEVLDASVRKDIENLFGCRSADQYGANETGSIAYECTNGNFHVMRSNVYVEILDEDDEVIADSIAGAYGGECAKGRIVVTSLSNNVMPFIRYDIGDKGAILNKKCSCGCNYPVLELYGGRQNDFVLLKDGGRLSPYIFVGMIDRLNAVTDGAVLQFHFAQRAYDKFKVRLYAEEADYEIKEIMLGIFEEDYPYDAELDIEFVDASMNVGINGKYAYFTNEITYRKEQEIMLAF